MVQIRFICNNVRFEQMKYSKWQIFKHIIAIGWHFLVTPCEHLMRRELLCTLYRKERRKKLLHNWYSSWLPSFPESNPTYFPYRIHIHAFEIYDAVQARNCMKMNATAAKNECERLVSRSIVTEWIVSVEWKTVEEHSAHTIIHRTMRLLRALNKSQIFHSLWLLLPLPANVIFTFLMFEWKAYEKCSANVFSYVIRFIG